MSHRSDFHVIELSGYVERECVRYTKGNADAEPMFVDVGVNGKKLEWK